MNLRVLKFGGTSVETPTHILAVARRILAFRRAGDAIVVVVSAMGQTTDELIHLARRVSRTPSRREMDMLLTTGERISMTLLAMCLESLGCPAISFTGSQSGIITDSRHTDARILFVRCHRIEEELARGRVVIVAGFQGVSREREVTTLGRGGSDTTAVALAIRLGADCCTIYTDVAGVFSADPRVVPGARCLPRIGYEPMVVLSHLGGRVLYRRAVLLSRKYRLPVEVRSSLTNEPGTWIPAASRDATPAARPTILPGGQPREARGRRAIPEGTAAKEEEPMETNGVLGIALESPIVWARILIDSGGPPSPSGEAGALPGEADPVFLFFHRTRLPGGDSLVQFAAVPEAEIGPWLEPVAWIPAGGRQPRIEVEREAALVSLVGEGVLASGEVLRRSEEILRNQGIPVWVCHTGTLSLSFVIPVDQGERASRVLHREWIEAQAGPQDPGAS